MVDFLNLGRVESQTADDYTEVEEHHKTIFLYSMIALGPLIPLNVISNTFVILGPVFLRQLRTPDNLLMVNLALSDICQGLFSMPVFLINVSPYHMHHIRGSRAGCEVRWVSILVPSVVSCLMLLAMCIERSLAVGAPFFYERNISNTVAIAASCFVWGLAILDTVFVDFKYDTSKALLYRCNIRANLPVWYIKGNILLVAISIIISLACAVHILVVVHKQRKFIRHLYAISGKHPRSNYVAPFLIFIFIILYIPTILNAFTAFVVNLDETTKLDLFSIAAILRSLNASINAKVYAYCRRVNRRAYWYMMTHWPTDYIFMASAIRDKTGEGPTRKVSPYSGTKPVRPKPCEATPVRKKKSWKYSIISKQMFSISSKMDLDNKSACSKEEPEVDTSVWNMILLTMKSPQHQSKSSRHELK